MLKFPATILEFDLNCEDLYEVANILNPVLSAKIQTSPFNLNIYHNEEEKVIIFDSEEAWGNVKFKFFYNKDKNTYQFNNKILQVNGQNFLSLFKNFNNKEIMHVKVMACSTELESPTFKMDIFTNLVERGKPKIKKEIYIASVNLQDISYLIKKIIPSINFIFGDLDYILMYFSGNNIEIYGTNRIKISWGILKNNIQLDPTKEYIVHIQKNNLIPLIRIISQLKDELVEIFLDENEKYCVFKTIKSEIKVEICLGNKMLRKSLNNIIHKPEEKINFTINELMKEIKILKNGTNKHYPALFIEIQNDKTILQIDNPNTGTVQRILPPGKINIPIKIDIFSLGEILGALDSNGEIFTISTEKYSGFLLKDNIVNHFLLNIE